MTHLLRRYAAAACLVAAAPAAAAQTVSSGHAEPPAAFDVNTIDPDTFRAIAVRVPNGQALAIDGRLDDPAWALASPVGDFIQREPNFGAPSTERTEVRILYDDTTLYFGWWLYDSAPDAIVASELKRDAGLGKGDQIKIVIDTFHDRRSAFAFNTNPLGARKDADAVDDGRIINYDWDAVWTCRTSRDGRGWYAEMAIPLSQLRFKGRLGDTTWGLNLCRVIIRKHEESYWVPYPREWGAEGFVRMSRAGVLGGLSDVSPPRRLELRPFAAPKIARDYDRGTPTQFDRKYGFDLRVGLTSNLTADLTYKTDFAQVEADEQIVNLSRFSLFFPEKRQFFTESAGIFDYGRSGGETTYLGGDNGAGTGPGLLSLFYSRRIGLNEGLEVPILGGGKVTGQVGPYTLGIINIETDHAAGPSGDDLQRANYSVVRVKRNVLAKSSVGGIFLNRQSGSGSYNRAAGFDAAISLGQHVNVTGLIARTDVAGGGSDHAGAFDLAWKSDRFGYDASYLDIGPQFHDEMGFIPRVGIRNPRAFAQWTPRPKWRGVRQLTFSGLANYYANYDGQLESRNQNAHFSIQRQDSSSIDLSVDRDFDRLPSPFAIGPAVIPVGGYDWTTVHATYRSNSSRRWYGGGGIDTGGYYNGDKQTLRAQFSFLLGRTFLVEQTLTRNRIRLPNAPRFVTDTYSARASYSFSPDLFVKAFLQYSDDRRLASLNLLAWFIYRPGSDLYAVYNTGWETGLPGAAPQLLRTRNRSFALKATYWLAR